VKCISESYLIGVEACESLRQNLKDFDDNYAKHNCQASLLIAARMGIDTVVDYWLKKHPRDIVKEDHNRKTALHCAAEGGHVDVVKRLLAAKADVKATDYFHTIPLHWAAKGGHSEVVRLLLAAGSNPNLQDFSAKTPLHFAVENGEPIQLLLEAKANIELVTQATKTPLHLAVLCRSSSSAENVAILVSARADLEALDKDKRTALLLAVEKNSLAIAQTLLDAKANPQAKDAYAKSSLDLAAKSPATFPKFQDLFAQFGCSI